VFPNLRLLHTIPHSVQVESLDVEGESLEFAIQVSRSYFSEQLSIQSDQSHIHRESHLVYAGYVSAHIVIQLEHVLHPADGVAVVAVSAPAAELFQSLQLLMTIRVFIFVAEFGAGTGLIQFVKEIRIEIALFIVQTLFCLFLFFPQPHRFDLLFHQFVHLNFDTLILVSGGLELLDVV